MSAKENLAAIEIVQTVMFGIYNLGMIYLLTQNGWEFGIGVGMLLGEAALATSWLKPKNL